MTRPGLEVVCAEEIGELGIPVRSVDPGAVAFDATERQLYQAVRWVRTATRVLLVVAELHAPTFGALERGLDRIDWGALLPADVGREVRVRATRARLHHTGAVAERVEAAITEAIGPPPGPGAGPGDPEPTDPSAVAVPPLRLDVRVVGQTATVRLDATGEVADRRGWRLEVAKAPLPPTVAAAVLHAIGWDGSMPLLDPMCGSGTIPIEAALLAAGRPPAVGRPHAVERWASFAPGTWASAGAPPRPQIGTPTVLAGDRDAGAVAAVRANADRADVSSTMDIAVQPLSAAADRAAHLPPGWIVTNPPWGHRMGGGDLRDLAATLGALLGRLPGWRLAVVTADPVTARHVGVPLQQRWRTSVGGTDVALLTSSTS